MRRVYLSNVEYDCLFRLGGDALLAVFATLRANKRKEVIRKVGKKGPVALIQDVTGLSRTTIEKHFPQLLEIGLVAIHPNGNIAIRSRKWSKKNLPGLLRRKQIPVNVYQKFTDTKTYMGFVRVHSNIEKQKRRIGIKAERLELLRAGEQNKFLPNGTDKLFLKLYRKGITYKSLNSTFRSNSTLSNLAFHKLLKGSDLDSVCNKTGGKYFKSKLIRLGLIKQVRINSRVSRDKSPENFYHLKSEKPFGGIFYKKRGIYHELSPDINLGNALSRCQKKAS